MKHLVIFFLLTIASFGQVRTFVDSLEVPDTDSAGVQDTTFHYVARGFEYAILTITLPDSSDSVYVGVGTSEASPKYGNIGLRDALTDDWVELITGNEVVNKKYFIAYGHRQKYFRLYSQGNAATIHYTLEAY